MSQNPDDKPSSTADPFWLRRADQAVVACFVALALMGTVFWWWNHGGTRNALLELEQTEPLPARFTVDLNAADWPELTLLPGIGPTLAQRILDSRETEGPFSNYDDLQRVKGIGPRTVEKLRPYLQVDCTVGRCKP